MRGSHTTPIRAVTLVLAAALASGARPTACLAQQDPSAKPRAAVDFGAVVDFVAPGSPAQRAGILPGDLLLALDGRSLRSASALLRTRDEVLWDGKKTASVAARRGTQDLWLTLEMASRLGIAWHPRMTPDAERAYLDGAKLPSGQLAERAAKFRAAAQAAEGAGEKSAASWLWGLSASVLPVGSRDAVPMLETSIRLARECGDGALAAEGMLPLGRALLAQGRRAEGEEQIRKAAAAIERVAAHTHDMSAVLNQVGDIELKRRDFAAASDCFRRAVAVEERIGAGSEELAGSIGNAGTAALDANRFDDAERDFRRALAIEDAIQQDGVGSAYYHNKLGMLAERRGRLADAEDEYRRALAIQDRRAPDSLDVADILNNLGNVCERRDHWDEAEAMLRRSLAIRKKLAAGTSDEADTTGNLGVLLQKRGKLDEAESLLRQALAIERAIDPNSLRVATWMTNVGSVVQDRGDLKAACELYQQALAMKERLAPGSTDVAYALNLLGALAVEQGQLATAEDYYQRALAIWSKFAPGTQEEAAALNNLGPVAHARGELDEAESYYQRALAIQQKAAPDSPDVATILSNLGTVYHDEGRLDKAEEVGKRALAIRRARQPGTLELAASLSNLGSIADDRGRLGEAEAAYTEALAICRRVAPGSMHEASALNNLAGVALSRGHLAEAEEMDRRALAMTERVAPDSLELAMRLRNLALARLKHGDAVEATALLGRAWAIVRRQSQNIGGDRARQAFGRQYAHYASLLVLAQLRLNRPEEAFTTLEQGRAQALAAALAERGLTEKLVAPDLWREYVRRRTAHDAAFKAAEIAAQKLTAARAAAAAHANQGAKDAAPTDAAAAKAAEQQLDQRREVEIRTRAAEQAAWAEIERKTPHAFPPSLDVAAACKRLPAGTLYAAFSVDTAVVTLFLASRERVQAFVLPTETSELEKRVGYVRRTVARDASGEGDEADRATPVGYDSEALRREALRALCQRLFPPEALAEIARAKHVVLSPDGFLWDLPFAALITNRAGAPTYLGLTVPLAYSPSLALYLDESQRAAQPARGARAASVLIVGDPLYDNARRAGVAAAGNAAPAHGAHGRQVGAAVVVASGKADASARRGAELRVLTPDGLPPAQLPAAGKEARRVAALYHTAAHTGVEPTEAWFRQHAGYARIIHLATHGYLNTWAPQSSGVLLAVPATSPPPGRFDNDGALQAWEIWTMKLNADLVVLSACETGRGAQVSGEGLVGLTRALEYAGARSVVASLWDVADASTAALMTAFHRRLRAGQAKDEALRGAMAELAATPGSAWSNPYYWAPFVLVGDTGRLTP